MDVLRPARTDGVGGDEPQQRLHLAGFAADAHAGTRLWQADAREARRHRAGQRAKQRPDPAEAEDRNRPTQKTKATEKPAAFRMRLR